MSRRRRQHAVVSLFAFQDVMAAVVGILFFVTMLLAILAADPPAEAAPPDPQELEQARAELAEIREEVRERIERRRELRRAMEGQPEEISRAVGEVRSLANTADALATSLERLRRERSAFEAKEVERSQALAAARSEAAELEAKRDRLQREQEAERRSLARVSYVLDASVGGERPWLVELAAAGVTVGSSDGAGAVLRFEGKEPVADFLAWAKRCDASAEYFVLLVKPSGLAKLDPLREALAKAGFKLGTDYTPEAWQVFEQ